MTHPCEHLPALDRIEAALEASCGALITLESLNSQLTERASKANGVQEHIGRATGSLRAAINSLRAAQRDGANALALGFVLEEDRPGALGVGPEAGQSRP